jgi:hypothetical protein
MACPVPAGDVHPTPVEFYITRPILLARLNFCGSELHGNIGTSFPSNELDDGDGFPTVLGQFPVSFPLLNKRLD